MHRENPKLLAPVSCEQLADDVQGHVRVEDELALRLQLDVGQLQQGCRLFFDLFDDLLVRACRVQPLREGLVGDIDEMVIPDLLGHPRAMFLCRCAVGCEPADGEHLRAAGVLQAVPGPQTPEQLVIAVHDHIVDVEVRIARTCRRSRAETASERFQSPDKTVRYGVARTSPSGLSAATA